MVVLRLLAVSIFASLVTGCGLYSDVQDLKGVLAAIPNPDECRSPGTSQNMVCNYRLIVKKVDGVFIGHFDPKLVKEGIEACNALPHKNYKCRTYEDYDFKLFEFEVENPQNVSNGVHDFTSVPHSHKLRIAYIKDAMESVR